MNQFPNEEKQYKYDLEERTAKFAEEIVKFTRSIKKDHISLPIITQLVRSGTSVGANYCEANGASSKRDFRNKIYICKKEIQETKYWLRIISKSSPESKEKAKKLWKEAQELTLIFGKIISLLKK
jgi:four helix bundle protein